MISTTHSNGFSLMEVMVSLAIVAFGVVGLAKLQSELVQETGETKNKLLALNLLNEKIADLKDFDTVVTQDSLYAYQDIDNNTGGTIQAGDYNGFRLSWCVESENCNGSEYKGNYYYSDVNSAPTTTNIHSSAYPDFKKIKLMVSWTNPKGENQTLSTETIVIPKTPQDAGIVASATVNLAKAPSHTLSYTT